MRKALVLSVFLSIVLFSSITFAYQDFNINQDFDDNLVQLDGYYVLFACTPVLASEGYCDGTGATNQADNMTVSWNSVNETMDIVDDNANLSKGVETRIYISDERDYQKYISWDSWLADNDTDFDITIPKGKEVVQYFRYYINNTNNIFPAYPSFRMFYYCDDMETSEDVTLNFTTGWHDSLMYIPANLEEDKECRFSVIYQWTRDTSPRLLMIDRFAVYTFDSEYSATSLPDSAVENVCGDTGVTTHFSTTIGSDAIAYKEVTFKSDKDKYGEDVTCGVMIANDTVLSRAVKRDWHTAFACQTGVSPVYDIHSFKYSYTRSFVAFNHYWCAYSPACSYDYYQSIGLFHAINEADNEWDASVGCYGQGCIGSVNPTRGTDFGIWGSTSGNNTVYDDYSIWGDNFWSESNSNIIGSQFRFYSTQIPYGTCPTVDYGVYEDMFETRCAGDTECSGGVQKYINTECRSQIIQDCGNCGCLNEDICKTGVDRWYCLTGYELVHENTNCTIVDSLICNYGCNSTLLSCNPDPETGQEQTACDNDADCITYCTDGIPSNRFYNGQCLSGQCSYSMEACEYGCDPLTLACAGEPITESATEWIEVWFGIDEAGAKFLIFVLVDLLSAGILTYYISKAGQGVGGASGLGAIFGIVTILWLVYFASIGWINAVIFVVLIILTGLITVYSLLKIFGG